MRAVLPPAVCLLVAVAAATVGPTYLPPAALWAGLWHPDQLAGVILWQIRLPRIVGALLVGAALAEAGAVYQGLFRNPLTDPYVIGSASGAAFGASLAVLLVGPALLPAGAFAGAVGSVALATALGLRSGGGRTLVSFLLIGYALSVMLGAAISLLLTLYRQDLQTIFFWELGSVAGVTWGAVERTAVLVAMGSVAPMLLRRDLDALLLGEATAEHLGVEVGRVRLALIASAGLLTAAAVSLAGVVGFVGLVAPHAVRRLVGESHGRLLPAAVWAGAAFVVACDTVARSDAALGEIPLGVVTGLVGGPLFVWLLSRRLAARPAEASL